ncbi:MAG: TIGR00282 family metallophosphoesterase [Bacteroidetes bacterium]|nr:MAG: TIGR00282 family metallophosphoesterase [Bacteroidota bacterium]
MNNKLNVLFIGDVVGEPGMNCIKKYLPELIRKYKSEFVIVNGENADKGKGLTEKEVNELFELGTHVITTGNHIWDNWKSKPILAANQRVIRPLNYPPGNVGLGYTFHTSEDETQICVLQLQGRTFMQTIDCPFRAADFALKSIQEKTKNIIVDFHADATAEKIAMGWHLDGRVSAIVGTHTHVQTADACILPNGTAYITDSGMTGPYNSVVGLKKEIALKRLLQQIPYKYEMGAGDERIAGVNIIIDTTTGQALKIEPFILPEFVKSVFEQFESE